MTEHTEREREREKKPARSSFVTAKMFGLLELSGSVENFNFQCSEQRKPGRCGYRFSSTRKLRTTTTLIGANVI